MFTKKEKIILVNLVNDKIDICERHIRKFEKDYKYYTEDRAKWIPGEKLGDPDSKYAQEIKRNIEFEYSKIDTYKELVRKIEEA